MDTEYQSQGHELPKHKDTGHCGLCCASASLAGGLDFWVAMAPSSTMEFNLHIPPPTLIADLFKPPIFA